MIRAVVDSNVLIAALLSPKGVPAQLLRRAVAGDYVVVSCPQLVEEFEDVARRDKFHGVIAETNIADVATWLREGEAFVDDPDDVPAVTRDPDDDYLVALARSHGAAILVSGDNDLREVSLDDVEVLTPRGFLHRLEASGR